MLTARQVARSFNARPPRVYATHMGKRVKIATNRKQLGKLTAMDHLGAICRLRMLERQLINAALAVDKAAQAAETDARPTYLPFMPSLKRLGKVAVRLQKHKAFMKKNKIRP